MSKKDKNPMWRASPRWQGETVFVVCGGLSVENQNLELLRGRKVVVINSSFYRVPWADLLFFSDSRWWREHKDHIARFAGEVVTLAPSAFAENYKKMRKVPPPGFLKTRIAWPCAARLCTLA